MFKSELLNLEASCVKAGHAPVRESSIKDSFITLTEIDLRKDIAESKQNTKPDSRDFFSSRKNEKSTGKVSSSEVATPGIELTPWVG
ncbi:hypothetical protein RRG08_041422 [Elysia crispata]|uniref:Uncharacterized protein n=1 Tax=Elysia crispata TaxID=231223 RepID=A0AAE0XSQ6_9GAST|nr:hypothetical protein RRG08_041422 [Elysia crispata]